MKLKFCRDAGVKILRWFSFGKPEYPTNEYQERLVVSKDFRKNY